MCLPVEREDILPPPSPKIHKVGGFGLSPEARVAWLGQGSLSFGVVSIVL